MKARIMPGWKLFWADTYAGLKIPILPPLPESLSEGSIVEVVQGSVSNNEEGIPLGEYFANIVGADGRTASIQVKFLEEVKE